MRNELLFAPPALSENAKKRENRSFERSIANVNPGGAQYENISTHIYMPLRCATSLVSHSGLARDSIPSERACARAAHAHACVCVCVRVRCRLISCSVIWY